MLELFGGRRVIEAPVAVESAGPAESIDQGCLTGERGGVGGIGIDDCVQRVEAFPSNC